MNNELIVDLYDGVEDEVEDDASGALSEQEITTIQERIAWLLKVVDALRSLKRSSALKQYHAMVIAPDIAELHRRLTQEREASSLHTYQGSVVVLEKYFAIDTQLAYFESRLGRLQHKVEEGKKVNSPEEL